MDYKNKFETPSPHIELHLFKDYNGHCYTPTPSFIKVQHLLNQSQCFSSPNKLHAVNKHQTLVTACGLLGARQTQTLTLTQTMPLVLGSMAAPGAAKRTKQP